MTDLIVADAGPLIGLARSESLWVLQRLYGRVLIPAAVRDELQVESARPGSKALLQAINEGWVVTAEAPRSQETERLAEILDPGEADAIALAIARNARLLIDDRRGRAVARRHGVTVIGTGAVLVAAKRANLVQRVSPILMQLAEHGYRVGSELQRKILELAGEE